jgi:hypothetical protein
MSLNKYIVCKRWAKRLHITVYNGWHRLLFFMGRVRDGLSSKSRLLRFFHFTPLEMTRKTSHDTTCAKGPLEQLLPPLGAPTTQTCFKRVATTTVGAGALTSQPNQGVSTCHHDQPSRLMWTETLGGSRRGGWTSNCRELTFLILSIP